MKTPTNVAYMDLISTCTTITAPEWAELMIGTTKADGEQIRSLIKKHLPELYNDLCLNFPNPYESKSVKKPGLLVYVHSSVEYFIKYR